MGTSGYSMKEAESILYLDIRRNSQRHAPTPLPHQSLPVLIKLLEHQEKVRGGNRKIPASDRSWNLVLENNFMVESEQCFSKGVPRKLRVPQNTVRGSERNSGINI